MKTIGLIGGMSWESTLEYYRILNEETKGIKGGLHSAKVLLHSLDFQEIEDLQHKGEWETLTQTMIQSAKLLEQAGADMILIATNTMHLMAREVSEGITIPLIHIADACAATIQDMGLHRVGLLGTRFTMEKDFYKRRLLEQHNIEVIIPEEEDREEIHNIIYNELCLGQFHERSKKKYEHIIMKLQQQGAEGIILGCTEIPLLMRGSKLSLPLFDTTTLHASYAVQLACK